VGPDYERPAIALPADYPVEALEGEAAVPAEWWTLYRDATLEELVAATRANNADIRLAAAQVEAEHNHLAGVIAVVDDGGWPILLLRMDNAAYVASAELAPGKARTAALFKKPSEALENAINHGRTAAVTAHDFIEMQGGLPIVIDGQVIGGIGASFDTPEHDVQIARAGLAVLTR